jgi:type IV secretion system protein VirB11
LPLFGKIGLTIPMPASTVRTQQAVDEIITELWQLDRLSGGLEDTGRTMFAADGERIVSLVAHHAGAEAQAERPRVSAELPETEERFEGLLPPVDTAPAFAIRKPAVFTLDDYVAAGIMTAAQAIPLREAVASRKNILVAGGTGTGKTTLTNALLAEIAGTSNQVVLIEDTRELLCRAPSLVTMRTEVAVTSLSDLVHSSLRLPPDRIHIGEVIAKCLISYPDKDKRAQ